jgi:hypothetical protein
MEMRSRIMETNGKKRNGSVVTVTAEGSVLTFAVTGMEPLVLDTATMAASVRERAVLHGMKQRIVDTAALSRDPATGASASPAEKHAAMAVLVAHYASGSDEWGIGRAAGEPRAAGGLTLQALADVQKVDLATMRKRVDELAERRGVKPAALLRGLATAPAVAARLAELQTARAKPGEGEALLGELMGG